MMYLPYMHGSPYNGMVYAGQLPNVPIRNSFFAPTPSSLSDCRSKTDDDLGSTTSESSSPVSSVVPTSVSVSNMEDESDSVKTDPIMMPSGQCDYQLYPVYMQAPVPEAYGQVTCSPQHYQNFPTSQLEAAIPSYVNMLPYQPQQEPITTAQMCPLQFQHVIYPGQLQQRLSKAQKGDSMLYPQNSESISGTISESQRASSNMFANAVSSTPCMGSGMPEYVCSYGYVNPSLVPSHSCTPMSGVMQSSIAPPTFHLGNNLIYTNVPDQISCNINKAPVSSISSTESAYLPECGKMDANKPQGTGVENLWLGNGSYKEYNHNGGSNLFISWNGAESELLRKLQNFKLEVRIVSRTCDDGIFDVVFENHLNARKAFLKQCEIRLRMVPPKDSCRNWLRNPSPKFLVKFETRCRLVVKKGKAEFHDTVGDLLMLNCQQRKGCIIWADQLKGHRIRIVSCEGNFMFPGGRVVQMKGISTNSDLQTPLGWVSYRCRSTRESFVTRRSSNKLSDYIYME